MSPSPSRRMRGLSLWFGSERGGGWMILVIAALAIGGAFVWQAYQAEELNRPGFAGG